MISCPQLQVTIGRYQRLFEEHDIEIDLPKVVQQLGETELMETIDRYDGVIAGDDQFSRRCWPRPRVSR